jgi:hypothetical protein
MTEEEIKCLKGTSAGEIIKLRQMALDGKSNLSLPCKLSDPLEQERPTYYAVSQTYWDTYLNEMGLEADHPKLIEVYGKQVQVIVCEESKRDEQ